MSRPTRWGNPHPLALGRDEAVRRYREDLLAGRLAVAVDDVVRELRGRDLACHCPLDEPCHADVLLDLANQQCAPRLVDTSSCCAERGPHAIVEGEMSAGTEDVEVAGLRIAFVRQGSGPPVVLLHGGFGLDHRSWRPQIDALSDEFTVVAWDAPGAGRSSDPPAHFRLPDYADCLAGFLAAIGVDRPHVVGLSFGAALALELYRHRPRLPRSLVLAGAYAGWAGSLPPEVVQERLARFLDEIDRPPSEWLPAYIPGMLSEHAPRHKADELLSLMLAIRPGAAATMLRGMAEADLRDVLPRIEVPSLLVYGELDARSPVAVGEDIHAAVPGSALAVLAGAGHACNLEAPDQFSTAVRSFLRTVPAWPGR